MPNRRLFARPRKPDACRGRIAQAGEASTISTAVNTRIQSFELAYRMQMEATDALDVSGETRETLDLYKADTVDGRQVLIARRLVERGVRVVQCYHGDEQP